MIIFRGHWRFSRRGDKEGDEGCANFLFCFVALFVFHLGFALCLYVCDM